MATLGDLERSIMDLLCDDDFDSVNEIGKQTLRHT